MTFINNTGQIIYIDNIGQMAYLQTLHAQIQHRAMRGVVTTKRPNAFPNDIFPILSNMVNSYLLAISPALLQQFPSTLRMCRSTNRRIRTFCAEIGAAENHG